MKDLNAQNSLLVGCLRPIFERQQLTHSHTSGNTQRVDKNNKLNQFPSFGSIFCRELDIDVPTVLRRVMCQVQFVDKEEVTRARTVTDPLRDSSNTAEAEVGSVFNALSVPFLFNIILFALKYLAHLRLSYFVWSI